MFQADVEPPAHQSFGIEFDFEPGQAKGRFHVFSAEQPEVVTSGAPSNTRLRMKGELPFSRRYRTSPGRRSGAASPPQWNTTPASTGTVWPVMVSLRAKATIWAATSSSLADRPRTERCF